MKTDEKIKSVVEDYDDIAQDYADEFYGNKEYEKYIDIFLKSLKGRKILDVGCGNGNDCRYISSKGFNVLGIDISKKMLEIAKANLPNIEFRLMDMCHMDFEDSSFDGIISNCSLFHVPSEILQDTLKEFNRVLKNKSKLFIVVAEGKWEQMVDEPYRSGQREVYMNYFTKEEIQQILENTKFNIKEFLIKHTVSDNALGNDEFVVLAENTKEM